MKVGLQIPNFTFPNGPEGFAEDIKTIVTDVEAAGFYSIWAMDHFFQLPMLGPVENDMHEGYSMLTYIAALTSKVKLGTMVTGNVYRHPGILIKTVTTLDVLSKGRAYFGVGTGWFEREALGLGIPFYGKIFSTRFEMLEETLQITKQMWSDNNGEFNGKHYQLKETICSPQPVQKPHLPILIGGSGEKKTLRMVAQYADACNIFATPGLEQMVQHKLHILKEHCQKLGRDYDAIEKTTLVSVVLGQTQMPDVSERKRPDGSIIQVQNLKTADTVIEHLTKLAEIGVDQVIFGIQNPIDEYQPLEIFKNDIIPAIKDL